MSWQAVRAKKQHAVEDAERRKIIYVKDPPLSVFLAEVLNGVERGDPLPPAGEQHYPRRFQLMHDGGAPFLAKPGTGVVYQKKMAARGVAWAPDDETARLIARILNHVDYPPYSKGEPPEVPASVLDPPK